ncbi:hypothetical protein HYE82_27735 [Streptomyces sp. BR123]|uniref:hypothetical protein n=1 Tax=Streptomyces sp. BR123 TaxID=2749828 RepID=UPI0015C4955C|nr:hypothetical protein [Streptomyces sp. BR123]NXY98093.1 hypothetical protein [Streptomyces sp. BR123]
MHHARQRLPLLLAAAVAVAALGACSGPSTEKQGGAAAATGEPPVKVTPQPDPANAALPLDAYGFDKSQQKVLQQAQDILTEACMRRIGFASFKNSNTYVAGPDTRRSTSGIGLVDADSAKKYGYRTGELPNRDAGAPAKRDPSETAALFGPQDGVPAHPGAPEGGCAGEAARKLYPKGPKGTSTTPAGNGLVDELTQQAGDRARGDSRVTAAISQWSSCMRDAGFQVKTPWELQQMEGTRWTGPVTGEEITAATTDVSCKQKTKLSDTWAAVLTAYQNTLIEKHKQDLDQEKKHLGEQVAFAEKVLKDGAA